MLKQHATIFRRLMIAVDIGVITACFFAAYALIDKRAFSEPLRRYSEFLPVILAIWIGLLFYLDMYRSFRLRSISEIVIMLLQTVLFGYVLVGWTAFVLKIDYIPRPLVTLTFLFSFMLITVQKIALVTFFRHLRRHGLNYRTLLLVGTGPRAQKFLRENNKSRAFGLKVLGLIDEDPAKKGIRVEGYLVLGALADVPFLIHNNQVDEVIFIIPRSWLDRIEPTMTFLETEGIKTHLAVDHFNLRFAKVELTSIFDFPLLTFETVSAGVGQLMIKRLLDLVISFVLLIILSPVFLITALVIKYTSPGPVFFRQERSSLNGRRFTLFKFRTMVNDAEQKLADLLSRNEMKGPAFKMEHDPRITPAGRFLRKFSIDELPQLWNVLWGDMSLVGPRPLLFNEVEQYDNWQRRRLTMRPGITCLWQVKGRNNITNFDEWMRLDLQYIDEWSLWLDARILLETIPVVLFGIGAK